MSRAMTQISTPCIKVCTIDPVSRLCAGCGRSLQEIGEWTRLTEQERRAIMARLPERLTRARPALTR
jgi:predicted Fe-S protein YdhL (DUF1289 family)